MDRFPKSLIEFQDRFSTEQECAAYLYSLRWPQGFVCPECGKDRAWSLKHKVATYECTDCHRQTSVTAGTIMHGTKLPLRTWFLAAFLMATHTNGISALQLQSMLGLGSYRTAWMLAGKLRRAMVDPERSPLAGIVEIDEASLPLRTKDDPPAGGGGRSHEGKMLIVGAVEVNEGKPGRLRLAVTKDYSADSPTLSSRQPWPPAARPKPTVGPAIQALPTSCTIPTSSAPWPRTSCCRGSTSLFPTSRRGRRVFTTGCGNPTFRRTWTSSCFGSIADARRMPPSARSSASGRRSHQLPTRC